MTVSNNLVTTPKAERAHRILDATAELVIRLGYDKTTVDDIARQAGVAKGTIYLHWKTREALFAALLRRERLAMLTDLKGHLETGSATLGDLVRGVMLGMLERPIMKASFLRDSEVLGRLVRRKRDSAAAAEGLEGIERVFRTLVKCGSTRADITPEEQATMMFSTLYGFLLVPPLLPTERRVADERLAELSAQTVDRALRTDQDATEDETAAILDFVDLGLGIAQKRLSESLRGPQ